MRWSIEQPIWVRVPVRQFVDLLDRCSRATDPLWEVASAAYLIYVGWRALTSLADGSLVSAYPRVHENLSRFMPLELLSFILVILGGFQFFAAWFDLRGPRAAMSFCSFAAWFTLALLFLFYSGTSTGMWIGVVFLLTAVFSFARAFALLVRGSGDGKH